MLHPVQGKNRYWGPVAISAITGKSTDEVSRMIRADSVRRQVTHTELFELTRCLYQCGFHVEPFFEGRDLSPLPTVAGWLRMPRDPATIYLLDAGGRWVVVRGRKMADANHREPVFLRSYKQRRCRVRNAWSVTSVGRSLEQG